MTLALVFAACLLASLAALVLVASALARALRRWQPPEALSPEGLYVWPVLVDEDELL